MDRREHTDRSEGSSEKEPGKEKSSGQERSARKGSASKEEVAEVFGAVLRREREAAGLTQARLAESSGLHDTYVSLLERGKNQPSLHVVIRLAEALGTSARRLAGEVEEELSK